MQAGFMWWIGDNYAGNYGQQRSRRMIPLRTFLEKGLRFSGGSDYPVTPFPARYGLWASIARKSLNGRYGPEPFGTKESVDNQVALAFYTRWAAHQLFLDERTGSIEPGKDADIAVWGRDFYSIPTAEIKDAKCELTIFRGRIVWNDNKSPLKLR
jgi:predicted amidohydrolase YtcJ